MYAFLRRLRLLHALGLTLFLGLCMGLPAWATSWNEIQVVDPINQDTLTVSESTDWSPQIYQQPSKTDQVFWPFTDSRWLWFNPASGYIAFGSHFKDLDPDQTASLRAWLATHYDPQRQPLTRLERLLWAERVYAVRDMPGEFWSQFYRLMAFETRDEPALSRTYVAKALPLLQASLADDANPRQTLANLYLLSEYHRRLGNEAESRAYLDKLRSLEVDAELERYRAYFLKIAAAQRAPAAATDTSPAENGKVKD